MSDYSIEIDEDVLNNTRPEYKSFHTPYQRQGKSTTRQGQKGKNAHQQQKRNKNNSRHNSQK